MKSLRRFFSARPRLASLALAALYIGVTALYPLFNRPGGQTYCLSTALDSFLGFSPPWIIPYVAWYLFLPGVAFYLMFRDPKQYTLTLLVMILGLVLSFLTYTLFQTTVPRPPVPGADLFSQLVRIIYGIDQPYNAFPSIHVLVTYALMQGAAKTRSLKKAAKAAIWGVGWLIILSTVMVKQHVVADILGGIALALLLRCLLSRYTSNDQPEPGPDFLL